MRALLIYPPISKLERYSSDIGHSGGNQIPLGLYYIAAYVREKKHEVDVVDAEANNLAGTDLVSRIDRFKPGIVGISSTTVAYHRAIEVAEEIKERFPDMPIVLGGPHVSSNVRHAMSPECFDYGVLNEGEVTFLRLLDTLESGGVIGDIEGLVFRENGRLIENPRRNFIEDLDTLPFPAYDLIHDISTYTPPPNNYVKMPVANMITSRGCPNQCTFCDQNIFGRKLRQASAKNVADEIELLYRKYGVREIAFVDDTFTLRPKRVREIFHLLNEGNIRIVWTCASRINTVDYDLLKFMKAKGCWHISFGIESGNEEILRRIKKNISLERTRHVISWCSQLGIKTKGFFIVGHPWERLETIEETIQFALRLPLDDVLITLNTPIPGTLQYAEAEKYGTLDTTDWTKFNYWRPVFQPHGLDRETLIAKQKEFYRRFYFRPRIILRYLLSFLSPSGVKRLMTLLRSLPFLFRMK